MKTISINELKQKMEEKDKSIKLVNALEASRFKKMHIPDSLNFTQPGELEQTLKKDDEIVVYCTNNICYKSRVLYDMLTDKGYCNVRRYSGGLEEWDQNGLPMEGVLISGEEAVGAD